MRYYSRNNELDFETAVRDINNSCFTPVFERYDKELKINSSKGVVEYFKQGIYAYVQSLKTFLGYVETNPQIYYAKENSRSIAIFMNILLLEKSGYENNISRLQKWPVDLKETYMYFYNQCEDYSAIVNKGFRDYQEKDK